MHPPGDFANIGIRGARCVTQSCAARGVGAGRQQVSKYDVPPVQGLFLDSRARSAPQQLRFNLKVFSKLSRTHPHDPGPRAKNFVFQFLFRGIRDEDGWTVSASTVVTSIDALTDADERESWSQPVELCDFTLPNALGTNCTPVRRQVAAPQQRKSGQIHDSEGCCGATEQDQGCRAATATSSTSAGGGGARHSARGAEISRLQARASGQDRSIVCHWSSFCAGRRCR